MFVFVERSGSDVRRRIIRGDHLPGMHNIRNIEEMPPGPVELDALDAAVETMKAAVENVEYGAFAWDKQRGMFVQIGRSVPVKQLCLNRYQERVRNGEMPSWIDTEKFKISQKLRATGIKFRRIRLCQIM